MTAERATVFQTVQVGLESTPGTGVAAGKVLQAVDLVAGIDGTFFKFTPRGQKFLTVVAPGKEWVTAKISGPATYNEIIYWLSSILVLVTPSSDTSNGKLWRITPAHNAADTRATFTVQQGSAVRAQEFEYGLVTEFGVEYDRDKVEFSGTLLGQALKDGATMTGTPTAIAVMPVLPSEVSVYLADSAAGLAGASASTRVLKCGWKIGNRSAPLWTLNAAAADFAANVETKPDITAHLLVEADSNGMGLLTNMRAGSSKWLRIKAINSTELDSGKPYLFQVDMCVKLSGKPKEFSDEDGVYAIDWNLEAAYDTTGAYAIQVLVRNALSAL